MMLYSELVANAYSHELREALKQNSKMMAASGTVSNTDLLQLSRETGNIPEDANVHEFILQSWDGFVHVILKRPAILHLELDTRVTVIGTMISSDTMIAETILLPQTHQILSLSRYLQWLALIPIWMLVVWLYHIPPLSILFELFSDPSIINPFIDMLYFAEDDHYL
ncbi:MAG: hypothetical protein ACW97A_04765 [Candidatus Thorarchaeota archaeon]|jgi:hypothetical protein